MNKKLSLIYVIALFPIFLNAQENILKKVSNSQELEPNTTGYMNCLGDTVISIGKYMYCYTNKFDKIAIVSIEGRSGFWAINRGEDIIFEVMGYDNGPDPISEGMFRIIRNGKVGFADMNGRILISPEFNTALPFKNGVAAICYGGRVFKEKEYSGWSDGRWGVINPNGKVLVEPVYEDIRSLQNGKVKVKKDGKWFEIVF